MTIIQTGTSSHGEAPGVDVASGGLQVGFNGSGITPLFEIFPATLNKGALSWSCVNNAGNYVISCVNASFGQSTILTLQDPGFTAANLTTDSGTVAAGSGSSSPGSLTGVTETLKFVRAGVTYYIPLYAVNT